ncbi:MAG TPA: hypothetical protein VKH40_19095 [Alloacidobacterium sp.]|nr:hypothetical protein [Alloacidobacterium sp.]
MLSTRDEIVPSSGFVMSVMDAVRREAAISEPTPLPPIAFPWVRALPVFVALAAVLVMLVAGLVEVARMPAATVQAPLLPPAVEQVLEQANAGWIAFALLLAFLSTLFSIRFATGKH